MSSDVKHCWVLCNESQLAENVTHFVIDYLNDLTEEEARFVAFAKRPKGVECYITLEAVSCIPSFSL